MKFSTKSTYGLRAMIQLAKQYEKGSISLTDVAKMEKISHSYLERIFSQLKRAKLVQAEKGASGGYRLIRDPENINVYDIIEAVEGKISPFYCLEKKGKIYCGVKCHCGVTYVLGNIQKTVNSTLKSINLNYLAKLK